MSDEEWKEKTRRAGRARGKKAREQALIAQGGHKPEIPAPTLAAALEVVHELLEMTIPGSAEPNYEARSFGVLVLSKLFRVRDRSEALALLAAVAPKVADDPQVHRLLDLDAARAKLIEAYQAGRISADELPPGVLGFPCAAEA